MFWVAALKILQNLWENLSIFPPFFPGPCGLFLSVSGFLSILLCEKVASRKLEA
jgi:hypothetical protein